MIKLITGVATALLLIFAPGMAKASSATEDNCITVREFVVEMRDLVKKPKSFTPEDSARMMKVTNEYRMSKGRPPIVADQVIFGFGPHNVEKEVIYYALFYKGCFLYGMSGPMKVENFAKQTTQAGVKDRPLDINNSPEVPL